MNNSNFICVTLSSYKTWFTSTDGFLKSLLEHNIVFRAPLAEHPGHCLPLADVWPPVRVRGTLQGQVLAGRVTAGLWGGFSGKGFPHGLTSSALCTGAGREWPNWLIKTAFQMWSNASAEFGTQIKKASPAAAEQWLCCVFAPQNSVPSILPPCRMKTRVGTPEPALVLSAHPCEGSVGSSIPVVPFILLCSPCPGSSSGQGLLCSAPLFSLHLCSGFIWFMHIFFTGLSPSFCPMGTAFSTILLLSFYASYIQIAQYISKYHPVTLCHTHLLLLLFEAAALCKQGGG